MRKNVLVISVLATAMAFGMVGLANAAQTEYKWSMDLDCALCHAKEAASLGLTAAAEEGTADGTKADAETTDEEGTADGAKADAETTDEEGTADGAKADAETTDEELGSAHTTEVAAYARMHVQNFKFECTTCHIESEGLEKAHKKLNSGKEATRLKRSEVDDSICLTCHQSEKLVEATADYTGLTDAKGTTVNPHELPKVGNHEIIQCFNCHQVHSEKAITETAIAACNSCHHAGVFECGTCH